MTVGELYAEGARRLTSAGVPDAGRDARRLLAAALGLGPERITPMLRETAPPGVEGRFAQMIAHRSRRQPVAQILGRRAFWGREFEVTCDVLDPRPETETLVALALDHPRPERLLDLGTGSGAILVSLLAEWPGTRGYGTDISSAAIAVAGRNARRHGVAARAAFRIADWLSEETDAYDLIVCNPPYIPAAEIPGLAPDVRDWEPAEALSPGASGLESYRQIAAHLVHCLRPGGWALFEIGLGQGPVVAEMFRRAGLSRIARHRDLDGRDRVVSMRAPD